MVETGIADLKASAKRFNELVASNAYLTSFIGSRKVPTQSKFILYRAKVADIHAALKSGDQAALQAITLVRDLIDHIVVMPTPTPELAGLEVAGKLAGFLIAKPPRRKGARGCGGRI